LYEKKESLKERLRKWRLDNSKETVKDNYELNNETYKANRRRLRSRGVLL